MPRRDGRRGARGAGAARARDRLRGRRAGARRRRAAGALPRGRSDARPPAEPPPPPRPSRATIDLADIQGNVLRGYTMPAAAYLLLRIVDVAAGARADARMLPQVATADAVGDEPPATAMNVAFTFAGLQALGLPDAVLASFPEAFREGMAARAEQLGDRGPSAPRALGVRHGERTCSSRVYAVDAEHLRAALAAILGRRRRAAASTLVHLQRAEALAGGTRPLRLLRRDRAARGRGRRRRAAARRRPARRRRRLARAWPPARCCSATSTRTATLPAAPARAVRPQRHVRRLPQAGDGRRRLPPLRRRPDALSGRRRRSSRPRSSAAGRTARRSRSRPSARTRRSRATRADQRLRLRGRPRRACAARSARTSAAPTRATTAASSTAG